ncbi:hypothetical protein ACRS9C_11425 [Serratia marcescens]|uniref:hypothetical protein n=1 Tax=Serratia marcescens TaxID=615 RepID=UPI003EDEDE81
MKKIIVLIGLSVSIVTVIARWWSLDDGLELDGVFECHAKLHTKMAANTCQGESIFDIFLAMHGTGKGYVIVAGSYTCPNAPPKMVENTVDLTYRKEGSYYALRFGPRSSELANLFKIFKYESVKVKIVPLNKNEYVIYSPMQSPMVCKRE